MRNIRRFIRWYRKLGTRPNFITDLWARFDDWGRPNPRP